MKTLARTIVISASLLATAAGFVSTAKASAFFGWQVANVAWNDTLNVRKYPANYSAKQAAYPNGAALSLTGRCTGGVNLDDISWQPLWKQRQAVRYEWCEIWHDPARDGNFVTGWVYGRYITPN